MPIIHDYAYIQVSNAAIGRVKLGIVLEKGDKGDRGLTGATGPAGANAGTVQWTAGEILGSPRVVMLDGGLAKLFTQDEEAFGKAVAVSRNSAVNGGLVTVVMVGELQSVGSFVTGEIYYAGPNGLLVTDSPADGIFLRVGQARSADVLVVEFGEPIAQG